MFATGPTSSGSTTCEQNTPLLDVPAMTRSILDNYDAHVNNFVEFLRDRLEIHLVYEGPDDVRQHILQKTTYACSVFCKPKKILKDVFPVMIGSRLDVAIRHCGVRSFTKPFDLSKEERFTFSEVDIGTGFFIIGGFLRHLPYFYTNDPTNTHVIQKKAVRVYSYNSQDRGKELSFYVSDVNKRRCGDVVIVHNDGTETEDDPRFFDHCPYPVHLTAYMNRLYRDENFDIDHLGNKVVVSPGHMFVKLFVKYLYGPLRERDWKLVKTRTNLVCNSIENGYLLHVLSRKTVYFKEAKSAGKMTNEPHGSHREIGCNGEVFMEKNIGCYREVSSQTYPLNPYLLYVIVRQISKKVKTSSVDSFHPSYLFFLCILGIFETKNVGRTTMMVRDTIVSTCNRLDPVYHDVPDDEFWARLRLEPEENGSHYVVVNEACIPVSKKCFDRIDLLQLKHDLGEIECYVRGRFVVVRYKTGLIMKRMQRVPIWVTPYDIEYWWYRCFGTLPECRAFSDVTSYIVDLNRFFNYTAFPKVILAFNAMKNAVLATDPKYAFYFMDTMSTYLRAPTSSHRVLIRPKEDGISKHFVLMIPQPTVAYMSFEGCTQEDCIVKRKDYDAFDCFRFYTVRLRVEYDPTTWIVFHPVRGHEDPESELLGTLIAGAPIRVESYSMHATLEKVDDGEYRINFTKKPFRVVQFHITGDKLVISVEQEHVCDTGDKLCSLHGQKGVIRVVEDKRMPLLDGKILPDLILNVYGYFRNTVGQIKEAVELGGGRDSSFVVNFLGVAIRPAKVFYGGTFYVSIVYFAVEHLYAPVRVKMDIVSGQGVKGRSRLGGMKIGNMELNALRGNGIAAVSEEKIFEHGDRISLADGTAVPKSVEVVKQDLHSYKFCLEYETQPSVLTTG